MAPGLSFPELREWIDQQDEYIDNRWEANDTPLPGLASPTFREHREKVRGKLAFALLAYLASMTVVAGILLASRRISSMDVFSLLDMMVVPILPLLGFAVGWYFHAQHGLGQRQP